MLTHNKECCRFHLFKVIKFQTKIALLRYRNFPWVR